MILDSKQIDLSELVRGFNNHVGDYKIEYSYINSMIDPSIEKEYTAAYTVKCFAKICNLKNGEELSIPFNLLNVPVRTSMGLKIDGTYYTFCPSNDRAPGWYNLDTKTNGLHMELVPVIGRKLTFKVHKGLINVELAKSKGTVNLGVFLKAISNLSFNDILKKLGIKNSVFRNSFLIEEPSYDECINLVLSAFLGKSGDPTAVNSVPEEYREREVFRFLGPGSINLNENSRERYNRQTLFSNRCENLELLKPVSYTNKENKLVTLKRGTILTKEMLDIIDETDLDTLYVEKNNKMFEIKKYKVEGNELQFEEILTELNILANNYHGFGLYVNRFDDIERVMITLEAEVKEEIFKRIDIINSYIRKEIISNNHVLSSLKIDLNLNLNSFLDRCKTDLKNAQTSDTTNAISDINKNGKVSMDYTGRTNNQIMEFKVSQQGAIDPTNIPENLKQGQNNQMNMHTIIDESNSIVSYYYKMNNGEIGERVLLKPLDRQGKYIAPFDTDLESNLVTCYFNDRHVTVPKEQIDYIESSVFITQSLPVAMVPCANSQDGKRNTMAANQNKQSVPCFMSEVQLFTTGAVNYEKSISNYIIRAKDLLQKIYEANIYFLDGISEEEFINSTLTLKDRNQIYPNSMTYIFETEFKDLNNNGNLVHEFSFPFLERSTNNTISHYKLNPSTDRKYKGDDIVIYNNSFKPNNKKRIAYVQTDVVPENELKVMKDFDVATGFNALVGFVPGGFEGMDDSVIISSGLIGTGKVDHPGSYNFTIELRDSDTHSEVFGFTNYEGSKFRDSLDENGLPKRGVYFKPKSVIANKIRNKNGVKNDIPVKLDSDKEGFIVEANLSSDGKTLSIVLAVYAAITVGDKIAGDHGNKGVIGKIMPIQDMPFTEDGRILEVLLNPLGIPSRMNLPQLYVTNIGQYCYNRDIRFEMSPMYRNSYEVLKQYLNSSDCQPIKLFDGRTCMPFIRKATVGMIYLKKQHHTAESKSYACGIPTKYSPVTNQPVQGKARGGGQKIGEMELWALEASQCWAIIQEILSFKSDDVESTKIFENQLQKGGDVVKLDSLNTKNNILISSQAMMRAVGIDLAEYKGRQVPHYMKDSMIRSLATKPIVDVEGLRDSNLFGTSSKGEIETHISRTKYGYIDLKASIINPILLYKSRIPKLLYANFYKKKDECKLVNLSQTKLMDMIYKRNLFLDNNNSTIPSVSYESEFLEFPITGMDAVIKLFEKCKMEFALSIQNKTYESVLNNNRITNEESRSEKLFSISELILDAKSLIDRGYEFKDFIITSYPVAPINYRNAIDGRTADLDSYYHKVLTETKQGDNNRDGIFKAITVLLGLDNSNLGHMNKKTAKTISEMFVGKDSDNDHGMHRNDMLGHIVSTSCRGVIIPGDVPFGYIGIPRQSCYIIYRKQIESRIKAEYPSLAENSLRLILENILDGIEVEDLNKVIQSLEEASEKYKTVYGNDAKLPKSYKDVVKFISNVDELMRQVLENSVIITGRQPTLHKDSIKGLYPIMVKGKALILNQLYCSTLNADFDGDQMWAIALHSKEAQLEAITKLSPINNVFSERDGSVAIVPNQDILLGLYQATMFKDNVLDYSSLNPSISRNVAFYSNLETMKSDLEIRAISYHQIVCITHSGNKYLSTAGRIYLNSIVKDGFTEEPFTNQINMSEINPSNYKELRFDGLVSKKTGTIKFVDSNGEERLYKTFGISDIVKDNILRIERVVSDSVRVQEICNFFDNIMNYGIMSALVFRLSLSHSSFKDNENRNKYKQKFSALIDKCDMYFNLGLMTEEDRKMVKIKASNIVSKEIKKTLMKDYKRNDELFIIIDSGARGNDSQVMNTTGMIGVVGKNNHEQMETPILNAYKYGLTSMDMSIMVVGTRFGFAVMQGDSAVAGEMTRDTVYMSSGIIVREHDCTSSRNMISVDYGEPIDSPLLKESNLVLNPDSSLFFETSNITENGLINDKVINYIHKNHIKKVLLEDDTVLTVKYRLSNLFQSQVRYKAITFGGYLDDRNNPMVTEETKLEHLYDLEYCTEKTIKFIEDNQFDYVRGRTILTCGTEDGICQKCYGLSNDNLKLVEIGFQAGVIAGQSMGERTMQLTLNAANKSGSGSGAANAIDITKSIIAGTVNSDSMSYAILSDLQGFVKIEDNGVKSIISDVTNKKVECYSEDLLVVDGEFVKEGIPLTMGIVRPTDLKLPSIENMPGRNSENTLDHFSYKRPFTMAKELFNLFYSSGVSIDFKHFEVLVRAEMCYCKVHYSTDPSIKPGTIVPFNKVINSIDKGELIKFRNVPLKKVERVITTSGFETGLTYNDPFKTLMYASVGDQYLGTNKTSIIGEVFTGTNIFTKEKRRPQPLIDMSIDNRTNSIVSDLIKPSEKISEVEVKELEIVEDDFDFSELLSELEDTNVFNSVAVTDDMYEDESKDVKETKEDVTEFKEALLNLDEELILEDLDDEISDSGLVEIEDLSTLESNNTFGSASKNH